MKKAICISKHRQYIVGGIYQYVKYQSGNYLVVDHKGRKKNHSDVIFKKTFLPMKTLVWSAILFFSVLLFAMIGESAIDFILRKLFGV